MWDFFREFYYMNLLLPIVTLVSIIYGLYNYRKLDLLKIFIFYSIISLSQGISALSLISIDNDLKVYGSHVVFMLNIFVIIEFIVIYIFLYQIIQSKRVKQGMKISSILFLLISIYTWIWEGGILNNPSEISIIEAFLITIPVLYYFVECLSNLTYSKITDNPNFWVNIGLLFLFTLNMPLFLVNTLFPFMLLGSIYIMNYVAYIVLYLFLTYAYLCKVKLVQS